jgi:hypothetical protein
MFGAMFGLDGARHLGQGHEEPELIASSMPWKLAPPVLVPIGLRERGKLPAPGNSAAVPDDRLARAQLKEIALRRFEAEERAARSLASTPLAGRTLERSEFDVLLRLADLALASGVPVQGSVMSASVGPTVVRLRADDSDTVITVTDGVLTLRNVSVEVVAS